MIFLLTWAAGLIGMEAVAWSCHRWVMHGPLWVLHASHHLPRARRFEANDLFGVFFALPSIALIGMGVAGKPVLLGLGLGMTSYGLLYLLFHDALAHSRFGRVPPPRNAYLKRLVAAHRLHNAHIGRDGARFFGFLWAPKG